MERSHTQMSEETVVERYAGNAYAARLAAGTAPIPRAPLRIQRCACGGLLQQEGECSECRSKRLARRRDETHPTLPTTNMAEVLASVPMTTPDDASEREAERLAAQIMRMPAPRVSMSRPPSIQRRASTSDFAPGVQQALQMTGAGSALPPSIRAYMEPRFGADLSDVRVHTGPQAETLTADLNAEAFTYGHHIWLGKAQAATDAQLMAHELTHVVQQTPQLAEGQGQPPAAPERMIQRKVEYYSLPPLPGYGSPGDRTHTVLMDALGGESANADLFFEINIPGGSRRGVHPGLVGRADLYRSEPQPHTLGVRFGGDPPMPEYLEAHRSARRGNSALSQREHRQLAAPIGTHGAPLTPRLCPLGFSADPGLCRMDVAPTTIKVGDIKSSSGADRLLGTYDQLGNYIAGIHQTRDNVNAFNQANPGSFNPAANPTWSATAQRMSRGDITLPARLDPSTYPNTTGPPTRVVGYDFAGRRQPYTETTAYLYLIFDTQHPGIWFYEYVPVSGPTSSSVGAAAQAQRQVHTRLQVQVMRPVNTTPTRPRRGARRFRRGAAAQTLRPAQRQRQRRIQRQSTDSFDLQQWRTAHFLPWRQEARRFLGSPEARTVEQVDALRRIRERTGITQISVPAEARELSRDLRRIQRWEEHGELFGRLRRIFGGLYVRVIQFYERVRERFRRLTESRRQRGRVGSGALGTIARLVFTILKKLAGIIVARVADRLMEAFHNGMTSYLEGVVGEQVDEVRVEVEAVRQRITDMEQGARAEYERIVDNLVGPYEEEIRVIEDVTNVVGDVAQIVNAARVAICVASCGLPPGLGCLWGCLGQIIGEVIINEIVQSCWFQREFLFPAVNTSSYIQQLPDKIARMIHGRLVEAMPAGLRPLLGTIETLPRTPLTPNDLDCDTSAPSPDASTRTTLETLAARHGAERVAALIGLLIHRGAVRPSATLSPELADKLDRFLAENRSVTADDLNRLRRELPGQFPGTSTVDVELTVIRNRVRGALPGRGAPAQERRAPPRIDIFRQPPDTQPRRPSGSGVTIFEF
jgi:hypothetical protein